MPRIDCECGNALLLADRQGPLLCPRCGRDLADNSLPIGSPESEPTIADLTPTTLGDKPDPDSDEKAYYSRLLSTLAAPDFRPDSASDAPSRIPTESSLQEKYDDSDSRIRLRDYFMPLVSIRAMGMAFGMQTFVAIFSILFLLTGLLSGGIHDHAPSRPLPCFYHIFFAPNIALENYFPQPSSGPFGGRVYFALHFLVNYLYFYFICLLFTRSFRRRRY